MSDDIRSAVSSAFDSVSSSAPTPEPSAPEAPAPEAVEAALEAPEANAAATETPAEGKPQAAAQTPNAGDKPGQTAAAVPTESTPAAPKVPEHKAPQSWKPALREHWAKVPPEIQAEVVRREREVQTALQEASEAKRTAGAFQQALQPYMWMMQAERQDPIQAVSGLLHTAAALRTAPAVHKAQLVAQIIQSYGVPVDAVAAFLEGQPPAQGEPQQPQQAALDPNQIVAQAEQRITQRLQQQAQQVRMTKAQSELEAFVNSGEAEFFEDVRPIMSSLLSAAAQSGIALSLKDAYNQAVAMSPDLKPVLQQREKAQKATVAQAATQRAKNAAASVRSNPAPVAAGAPKDLRGDLEAAIARYSGR